MTERVPDRYRITIKDRHVVAGEVSESTTELFGDLLFANDGYIIKYDEHEGDFAGTTTHIAVHEPASVRLARGGDYGLDLVLKEGERHNCLYETPFGDFQMGVYAKKVDSEMNDDGGNLRFSYSLDIGGGEVSENDLEITVKGIRRKGGAACQKW